MRFPSNDDVLSVHSYIQYSMPILSAAKIVSKAIGDFASIHLRNGEDWKKACLMIDRHQLSTLFTSYQCEVPV